jgi:hypothetical protein
MCPSAWIPAPAIVTSGAGSSRTDATACVATRTMLRERKLRRKRQNGDAKKWK